MPGAARMAPMSELHDPLLRWYDAHARDLPWRAVSATAWSVMVSEFMLQQTPVARVLPVHEQWLTRYRGWVYGVGFGAQLGFGLVTIITSAMAGTTSASASITS